MDESDVDRMNGRKWAEEVVEDLKTRSYSYQQGFWRVVKSLLQPKEIDPLAMSDEEARNFGRQTVEFGQYRGQRYDDVPLDYWEWLADQNRDVQRYLRSRRIRSEMTG